jgi:AraC-like DNA-binding protein
MKAKNYAHFHLFEHGEGWIELEGSGEQILLHTGDLVILPQGAAHVLKDKPETSAVDVDHLLECRDDHILRYGGSGSETTTVCGGFSFENRIGNPIFSLLPELIHVSCEKLEGRAWLESSLKLLAHEAQFPREGSASIISQITGIIFVQAVRAWIEEQPQGQGGWLGALRDKQISAALNLIHQKPGEEWTISKLAAQVGMSRSPFATKFTSLVGEPPLAYLTKWRMNVAAAYLRENQLTIRQIAGLVGYESQASFTNAFKRIFSISPKGYRDKNRLSASSSLTKSTPLVATSSN